jgi:hypothetical protein
MNITFKTAAPTAIRALVIACASLALATGAQAQRHGGGGGHYAHGGYHGGYHGGHRGGAGWVWGGLGLGLGLGLASYYNSYPYYYRDPGYVVVEPPTVVYDNPQPVYSQPVPARSYSTQPVIYPRNGQSAAKMDADANACSEWAGKQPNATADQSVFQRGIQACMDARGYTVR